MSNTDFYSHSNIEEKLKELGNEYMSKLKDLKYKSNFENQGEKRKLLMITKVYIIFSQLASGIIKFERIISKG